MKTSLRASRWSLPVRAFVIAICLFVIGHATAADTKYPDVVEEPPLSPQEQLKTFHLPPGFEIQLVAAEPEVHKPINFNFDAAGRLWFTGSVEYPFPKGENVKTHDTLSVIHGFNSDGSASKITTFADGLNIPIGVTPIGGNEAIVFSIPNVYRLRDVDGDGRAEKREIMFGPFGQRDTHGLNNSFTYAIDGWIYACHGYVNSSTVKGTDGEQIQLEGGNVYRFRPDGSHIEFFCHGQVNPFGLAFDRLGNLFSADCHTEPAYMLLRGAYYPSFGKPHDGLGFGPQIMEHSHGSTGIAGITCYEAEQFPEEYRHNLFIGNPITHRVNRDKLVAHGSSFEAVEQPDFITCDDPWFRPVQIKLGPDGALYIGDFYNCIIGHYEVPLNHPKRDRERGRLWRVVYTGAAKSPGPLPASPNVAAANANELVDLLADANITVRSLATNELVDRIGKPCVPTLKARLKDNASAASLRAHGLWVLERLGALDDEMVGRLLDDSDRAVRIHVLKALAERSKTGWSPALAQSVRGKLSDDDAFVSRAAADCLGQHLDADNVKPLLERWHSTPADDAQLIHTIRMALRDHLKLPNVLAAVGSSTSEFDFSDEQRGQLAQLCLGIPTTTAADVALEYLKNKPDAVLDLGNTVYPLMRHASVERLNEVFALALAYRDGHGAKARDLRDRVGQEHAILLGIERAAHERGVPVPDSITAWAKEVATKTMSAKSGNTRLLGIELAQEMKLQGAHAQLADLVLSDKNPEVRTDALMACVAIDGPASVEVLDKILTSPKEDVGLRQRSARALGTVDNDGARECLLKFLSTAPERLAVEVATSLAKSNAGSEALLTAIAAGKASPRLLQEVSVTAQLNQQKIDKLDDRIAKLTAGLPSRDEQLRRLIEDRLTGFEKIKPDPARGKQVFTKNCAVCHKISNEGAKVGPELDGIGIRGPARIMEDLLDPNRNVDQNFRTTTLITADGLTLSGLLVREDSALLVLVDNVGKEQRVPANKIEEGTRQVSPMSPMPANLKDAIPEEEFYHLIGYLLEQQAKK